MSGSTIDSFKSAGFIVRLIIVIIFAILIGVLVHDAKCWYNSLKKPSCELSSGWNIFLWIIFGLLFAWAWAKTDQCNAKMGVLFIPILLLILGWALLLFKSRSPECARYLILSAAILAVLQMFASWKVSKSAGVITLLLAAWLIYQTVVTWQLKEEVC